MTQPYALSPIPPKVSFELSGYFYTNRSIADIQKVLYRHVLDFAKYVETCPDGTIKACKSAASAGAINRADVAFFRVYPIANGYRCVASVIYKPTAIFWILIVLLLNTWIFWIIPLVFYYSQKRIVRNAIQQVLAQVKREVEEDTSSPTNRGELI